MSGLLIEAHDWPEDIRPYVRDVEMHLLKRAILHCTSRKDRRARRSLPGHASDTARGWPSLFAGHRRRYPWRLGNPFLANGGGRRSFHGV